MRDRKRRGSWEGNEGRKSRRVMREGREGGR